MKMANVVAKWEASGDSAFIFLFNCFSVSTLNSLRVFPRASSAFAVTVAFAFINNVVSLSSFLTSTSLFSLLMSLFEFVLLYWLWLSLHWL